MGLNLKTLRGSDDAGLPALAFAMSAVQSINVEIDTAATVELSPGIYYLISRDSDFAFTHGTGDLSGHVRMPWFKDVYLELAITADTTLEITLPDGVAGSVVLVPTEVH